MSSVDDSSGFFSASDEDDEEAEEPPLPGMPGTTAELFSVDGGWREETFPRCTPLMLYIGRRRLPIYYSRARTPTAEGTPALNIEQRGSTPQHQREDLRHLLCEARLDSDHYVIIHRSKIRIFQEFRSLCNLY